MLLNNLVDVLDNTEHICVIFMGHVLYNGVLDKMCIEHLYYECDICNIHAENNVLLIEILP